MSNVLSRPIDLDQRSCREAPPVLGRVTLALGSRVWLEDRCFIVENWSTTGSVEMREVLSDGHLGSLVFVPLHVVQEAYAAQRVDHERRMGTAAMRPILWNLMSEGQTRTFMLRSACVNFVNDPAHARHELLSTIDRLPGTAKDLQIRLAEHFRLVDRNGNWPSEMTVVPKASTIRSWCDKVQQPGGYSNLASKWARYLQDPLSQVDVRYHPVFQVAVERADLGSTKATTMLVAQVISDCQSLAADGGDEADLAIPTPGLVKRVLKVLLESGAIDLTSAMNRRSRRARNKGGAHRGGERADHPGQILELDQSKVDVVFVDEDGKEVTFQVILAVDAFSGRIMSLLVTAGHPSATDVNLMVADVLLGNPLCEPWADYPRPWDGRLCPVFITIDQGRNFDNAQAREAGAHCGYQICEAVKGQPGTKPHVESTFRVISLLLQCFTSHTGGRVEQRGERSYLLDGAPRCTVEQFEVVLRQMAHLINLRPMASRGGLSREARFISGLPVAPGIDFVPELPAVYPLYKRVERSLGSSGVSLPKLGYYDSALDDRALLGSRHAPRKVDVYYHPRRRDTAHTFVEANDTWVTLFPNGQRVPEGSFTAGMQELALQHMQTVPPHLQGAAGRLGVDIAAHHIAKGLERPTDTPMPELEQEAAHPASDVQPRSDHPRHVQCGQLARPKFSLPADEGWL